MAKRQRRDEVEPGRIAGGAVVELAAVEPLVLGEGPGAFVLQVSAQVRAPWGPLFANQPVAL